MDVQETFGWRATAGHGMPCPYTSKTDHFRRTLERSRTSWREIQAQLVPMFRDLAAAKAKNVKMSGNHFLSWIVRVVLRRPG